MQLPTVYEDSFLVSGIMCAGGCGFNIDYDIREFLQKKFPRAKIFIASSPTRNWMHQYHIEIQSSELVNVDNLTIDIQEVVLGAENGRFKVFDKNTFVEIKSQNWLNIVVNIVAIASIITLSVIFPPSLILTLGLGAICFAVTLFTARHYILNFINSLRNKDFLSMPVTVTLGWFLALGHAIYHTVSMSGISGFAMNFMSFIMPLTLVTIVNVMDEIKSQIIKKTQRVVLDGIKSLFPEMQDEYEGIQLQNSEVQNFRGKQCTVETFIANKDAYLRYKRHTICADMLLKVKAGECFPVDGEIVFGSTYVDRSILNGEPASAAEVGAFVESGSINIWQDVIILTKESEYFSTANRLLLHANAAEKPHDSIQSNTRNNKFYYFYFGLFGVGLVLSFVLSFVLGVFTISMMLQTLVGVLFAICPCTIGIAYFLPGLLKDYQLNNEGVILSNPNLPRDIADFDVFIFDKTGTLTDESKVVAFEGISDALWSKIYHIEKKLGRKHPIALALQKYVEGSNLNISDQETFENIEISASGISAKLNGQTITIGNAKYLQSKEICIPQEVLIGNASVYVAENGNYTGNISIRHELRSGMLQSLQKLNSKNNENHDPISLNPKKFIMLTGDNESSANELNNLCGNIFEVSAGQDPTQKAKEIEQIVKSHPNKKICFIGDGLNDALCSKKLKEHGGVSIAINSSAKAAFFTDMSLNGSLDYLFVQQEIDKQEQVVIKQNRWILVYGAIVFLAFLISLQLTGIGMSPLLIMGIMFSTTLFTLFNSYRMQIKTHCLLNHNKLSLLDKFMQSNFSIGLLVGGSLLLVVAILIASLTSMHLALPLFVFSGGVVSVLSSSLLVAATVMLSGFAAATCAYLLKNYSLNSSNAENKPDENNIIKPETDDKAFGL